MENAIAMAMKDRGAHPEARLWQAVLVNTIEEWVSGPLRLRREAEEFLFNSEADFRLVCASAGMNPEYLQSRLTRLRKQSAVRLDYQVAA